jgi:hypothetical protein
VSRNALGLAMGALLGATPACAAEPWIGRWAPDIKACNGTGGNALWPLQVTPLALKWPATHCTVHKSYKVGQAWHVGARCSGDGVVSMVPMRLQMRGDRLVLDWGRARAEELRRCP